MKNEILFYATHGKSRVQKNPNVLFQEMNLRNMSRDHLLSKLDTNKWILMEMNRKTVVSALAFD
jgi:hypothetical protein